MHLIRFSVCCLIIYVTIVNGEIITFLKDKKVVCVATDSDIKSTIYLDPPIRKVLNPIDEFVCSKNKSQNTISCLNSNNSTRGNIDIVSLLANSNLSWRNTTNTTFFITDQRWEDSEIKYGSTFPPKNKSSISIYTDSKGWIRTNNTNASVKTKSSDEITEKPVFWKLHKLDFIKAVNKCKTESIKIYHNGVLYVSMFVYLDHDSTLNISLNSNGVHTARNITTQKKWEKFQLQINATNITTLSIKCDHRKNKVKKGYWAIDEIKLYTKTIRASEAQLDDESQRHTCKLLHNSSVTKRKCGFGKFGNDCNITCDDIFHNKTYCENYTICIENTSESHSNKTDESTEKRNITCTLFQKPLESHTLTTKTNPLVTQDSQKRLTKVTTSTPITSLHTNSTDSESSTSTVTSTKKTTKTRKSTVEETRPTQKSTTETNIPQKTVEEKIDFNNSTTTDSTVQTENDAPKAQFESIAFVCLILVFIFAISLLIYLAVAYLLKIYPFELLKTRIPKRQSWSLEDIRQFTEHYIMNNLKRVRSKADLPQESELAVLIEPTHQERSVPKISSVPIKLDKFEEYLMKSLENDPYSNDLTMQYRRIQTKVDKPCIVGLLSKNLSKNRYKNLIAYDDTRVVLSDGDSDYINANYVDGYENARAFIATQAPLKTTLGDFWSMIWQERVSYIIMLTELVEAGTVKCEQYWPDPEHKARFGKILIESVTIKIFSDYVDQQFKVTRDDKTRIVHHLQYKTWPDHGVPLYPQNFMPFVKRLLAMPQKNSPIVVHCNAGCGRTGTLILCDIVLRMAAKEKTLDFVKVLTKMREQRVNLVNNANQYVFAHFVVLECLFGVDFSIPINDSFQDEVWKTLRKTTVKPLIEQLDKVMGQFKKRQSYFTSSLSDEDKMKNRFSNILPGHAQIYLPISSENQCSYINAIFVDCYRCPKKFIVTQQPLLNTVKDFWTMVKEYTVNTIVSLNEIDENDTSCPQFWLWSDKDTKLQIQEEIDEKAYNITKIKLSDRTVEKTVNVIKMKKWKKETTYPSSAKDLILTWKETFNSSWKGNSQIVVTCYDGALASGLFVSLAYLLEKINYEQSCDVFSAVRTVRQSREQFVQEWGQLEFLYKAAKVYIEEFDNYDNFDN